MPLHTTQTGATVMLIPNEPTHPRTPQLRRSHAHLEERDTNVVKMYRAGLPLKHIATEVGLSERRVRALVAASARTPGQRQRWFDEHERRAVKFRSRRQASQRRFAPTPVN